MIERLCVIGAPSACGGADTELDHQMYCWEQMGIEVHICPTEDLERNLISGLKGRNCILHATKDWKSLDGFHVISFCNKSFLDNIEHIHKSAKTTAFVNCMTWNFPKEIVAQYKGLIDFHIYQTTHQYEKLAPELRKGSNPYRPLFVSPYFYLPYFPFLPQDRSGSEFRFGRISRADADKYDKHQLQIYESFVSPLEKAGIILGWSGQVKQKFQCNAPEFIRVLSPGQMTAQEFYQSCDAVVMSTATFENLPRVGFEAMASGAVLVVDNRGGWKLQVEDGYTGFLCNSPPEFIYKISRIAFEKDERISMRHEARRKLETEWGEQAAMDSWAKIFEQWQRL